MDNFFCKKIKYVRNKEKNTLNRKDCVCDTICPRSSYPFYIVPKYTKWLTTSWTYCMK